jgi:hypothetical protein
MSARGYVLAVLLVIAMICLRNCGFAVRVTFVTAPSDQASAPLTPASSTCSPEPRDKGSRMDRKQMTRLITARPGMTSAAPLRIA